MYSLVVKTNEVTDLRLGESQMNTKNWEIRKCQGEGWNAYAKYADGFCMFAGHFKTGADARAFARGQFEVRR